MEPGGVSVRYVVEERPGVAAVRNRALDETTERDLLIFIDDDEDPEPGWLAALVGMWATTGCQAVAGPVIPVYEVEPEEWVRQGGVLRAQVLAHRHDPPGGGLQLPAAGSEVRAPGRAALR